MQSRMGTSLCLVLRIWVLYSYRANDMGIKLIASRNSEFSGLVALEMKMSHMDRYFS
jgi:hypothetical protein